RLSSSAPSSSFAYSESDVAASTNPSDPFRCSPQLVCCLPCHLLREVSERAEVLYKSNHAEPHHLAVEQDYVLRFCQVSELLDPETLLRGEILGQFERFGRTPSPLSDGLLEALRNLGKIRDVFRATVFQHPRKLLEALLACVNGEFDARSPE